MPDGDLAEQRYVLMSRAIAQERNHYKFVLMKLASLTVLSNLDITKDAVELSNQAKEAILYWSGDRRDKDHPPRPGMIWSEKYLMWTDPDTRTPERKALDEKIVSDIDARLKPRDPIKLDQQGRVIYICGKCGEEKVSP